MILFQKKITGHRISFQKQEWGYTEKSTIDENRIFHSYYFFGIRVWRKLIFHEIVPQWAVIQVGAYGSTDWSSSQPELIDRSKRKEILKEIKI